MCSVKIFGFCIQSEEIFGYYIFGSFRNLVVLGFYDLGDRFRI